MSISMEDCLKKITNHTGTIQELGKQLNQFLTTYNDLENLLNDARTKEDKIKEDLELHSIFIEQGSTELSETTEKLNKDIKSNLIEASAALRKYNTECETRLNSLCIQIGDLIETFQQKMTMLEDYLHSVENISDGVNAAPGRFAEIVEESFREVTQQLIREAVTPDKIKKMMKTYVADPLNRMEENMADMKHSIYDLYKGLKSLDDKVERIMIDNEEQEHIEESVMEQKEVGA